MLDDPDISKPSSSGSSLRVAGLLAESRQGQNKEGRDAGPEVRAQGPERRRPDEGSGPSPFGTAAAGPRWEMRPARRAGPGQDRREGRGPGVDRGTMLPEPPLGRGPAALAFGSVRRGAPRGVVGPGARPVALDPGGAEEVGCLFCVSTSRPWGSATRSMSRTLVCLA